MDPKTLEILKEALAAIKADLVSKHLLGGLDHGKPAVDAKPEAVAVKVEGSPDEEAAESPAEEAAEPADEDDKKPVLGHLGHLAHLG